MIPFGLAQLFQLPSGQNGQGLFGQGLFNLGMNGGLLGEGQLAGQLTEGQLQAMMNGEGLQKGLFAGVLQNVLAEGGLSNLGLSELGEVPDLANINLDELSPEELKALEEAKALMAEGDGQEGALVQITQIITVVYEEFTLLSSSGMSFDGLNSTQQLAAAYMDMGMTPEEANSRAARLTIMMLVMDNRMSMADLLESLHSPQGLGLEQKHQSAFIQIEQTITKFTLASTGSHTASLAESIRNGASLQDVAQNMPQNAEKAAEILASLKASGQSNGDAENPEAAARILREGNGQQRGQQNNLFGNAFGRMENLLSVLADEAAKHPDGADLAKQLKNMAGAVKRISQNVINEGGLQQLEANLPQTRSNFNARDASLQSLAGQAAKPDVDTNQTQKVQENLKAQISEEQPMPERPNPERQSLRAERAETLLNRGVGGDNPGNNSNTLASREPALVEPQQPTYIVRSSAAGGVEVVNPQTGEVIQAANPAQSASPSFSSNTGEASATMTQSRGLEAALQARLTQQVSVHVRNLAGHGGGQIVVGLNPPEMGRVQVRLEILEGSVKGAITVQRADVADTIARDIRSLENAFKEMGLELGHEGISVQLEQNPADQEKDNNNNQEQGSGTRLAGSEAGGESLDEDQDDGRWINPDRILDVRA